MPELRRSVLSIAGFDPSSGAGISADLKTFESHKVYGYAVCTAITFQNEYHWAGVSWVDVEDILSQINIVFDSANCLDYVKIGMIGNMGNLLVILNHLKAKNNNVRIIWDPIIATSSGFRIHEYLDKSLLESILNQVYLLTPNINELLDLFPDWSKSAESVKSFETNILLKGGHDNEIKGESNDKLFIKTNVIHIPGERMPVSKHGTGCVHSASITANLANGVELVDSCVKARKYMNDFIGSNSGKLGYHLV